ncbi:uncharacterized protein [Centruroides vittatus]|uniref:uncharacterized protein n=1 Tax=Centruroides vittatus TaxID=120091 RepID=UPI00350F1DBD
MMKIPTYIYKCLSYTQNTRSKLVILGTGWGGYSVLNSINKNLYDIAVVSPRNYFLFTPLLCSTTVGTLEFRSIIEPVRKLRNFHSTDQFHLAYAVSLDTKNKFVTCKNVIRPDDEYQLKYDKLIISVGALNNTYGIPGVKEYTFFLKEINDAMKIRNKILDNFEVALEPNTSEDERKRLLHIVIVGGGPTGIEFGAELYDFVKQDVSRYYKKQKDLIKVTLIEEKKILSTFDKKLQSYAEKKIRQRDNFILVKSTVVEVKPKSVVLANGDNISCGLVVWSTGLAPHEFTNGLNVSKTQNGRILTDNYLRILGEENKDIYAIGDCSEIQNMPLPATAQVAERQGRYLAKCLNKTDTADIPEFHFKSMGMLAYLGEYTALSDLPEMKLQGFFSWFLWRSAYLTRLGSWRSRMQVPMDWLKTLLFGRDISRL